jgi:peptidoglycan/xylan/chitin deacetylase (PgdA/CDA1 family)
MTLGSGGSFSTEWSATVNAGNFLARRGRNYDASKKATQYGPIVMDYAADYSASSQGNSRLCVYGWMKDPLVEYYIIEDWVNWCPSAQGGSKTVTIDGAEYEIFQLDHTGPTILGNTQTFKQYFSVRKSKRTSGTITVSDHFKAWENAGWNIGNLTEVALNVEGWESSGKANVSKLTIGEGSGSSSQQSNNQQQNWNQQSQQNNNQQQGWNQNNDWNNQWNQQQNNTQPANNNTQVQANKKLCAISFDDGASATSKSDPGYRIIDALIKNNMTATFFNVGDWIKSNDQIKYEYQNGMEVANHTQSHPHLGQMGASQIRGEWENCNNKLKSIIGADPSKLMRLPYLESNATVQSALNDVPLISCAIDTQDWNGASKDQIVNTIKQAAQNGSLEGAIVLCHENYATTAAAMEEVLPWLAQNGYQNVNISDMAKAHGKTLAGGQVHTRA